MDLRYKLTIQKLWISSKLCIIIGSNFDFLTWFTDINVFKNVFTIKFVLIAQ